MPSSSRGTAIAFRVDASAAIGAGHLTRCRSLAQAVRDAGGTALFVLGDASVDRAEALADDGHHVAVLPGTALDRLDGADCAATASACHGHGAGTVVVDHYGADDAYLSGLADAELTVGVVDDLGDRELSAARWILNQSLGASPSLYAPADGRTILLGPRYALLRPQFRAARAGLPRAFSPDDARVLVTFGGGAPAVLYADLLHALEGAAGRLAIRVLCGDSEPDAGLVAAAASSRHDVDVLGHVDDMASQIAWSDVAVCAGGSTCLELLALGTPMVVAALAENQLPNVAALVDGGLAVPFDGTGEAAGAVARLLAAPARRAAMSRRGAAIVDGAGAGRGASSLLAAARTEVHVAAA